MGSDVYSHIRDGLHGLVPTFFRASLFWMALIIQSHQQEWKTRVVGGFGAEREEWASLSTVVGQVDPIVGTTPHPV